MIVIATIHWVLTMCWVLSILWWWQHYLHFFRWGNWCLHFLKFSRGHIAYKWQTPLIVSSQLVSEAHTVFLTIPSDRDFQSPSEVLLWFITEMFVWLFGTVSENSWSSENWKLWVEKNMMITFTQITLSVDLALPVHLIFLPPAWQHLHVQLMTLRINWKVKISSQHLRWQSPNVTRVWGIFCLTIWPDPTDRKGVNKSFLTIY